MDGKKTITFNLTVKEMEALERLAADLRQTLWCIGRFSSHKIDRVRIHVVRIMSLL